ncbi:MAG TPA: hypothetical protein VKP61_02355 [Candidatus Acidoferrum sp.]|nr:hypothetical protein [Candidatus Acidoferrum sp.]
MRKALVFFLLAGVCVAAAWRYFRPDFSFRADASSEGGLPASVLVNRDGREVKIIRGVVSESDLFKTVRRIVKD